MLDHMEILFLFFEKSPLEFSIVANPGDSPAHNGEISFSFTPCVVSGFWTDHSHCARCHLIAVLICTWPFPSLAPAFLILVAVFPASPDPSSYTRHPHRSLDTNHRPSRPFSGLWSPTQTLCSRNPGAVNGQEPGEAAGSSSEEACWRGQSVLNAQSRTTESYCFREEDSGRVQGAW